MNLTQLVTGAAHDQSRQALFRTPTMAANGKVPRIQQVLIIITIRMDVTFAYFHSAQFALFIALMSDIAADHFQTL